MNKSPMNKEQSYQEMIEQLKSLIADEYDLIANLANTSALLNQFMDHINWVGFYLFKDGELVLGPFQGKPACIRIPIGKGVCGTAVARKETIVVPNVHEFPGHIACDEASNSEIVVPMIKGDTIYGVLDVDSPIFERFDSIDQHYLEQVVRFLIDHHF
ncbi:MAG TPA: GAF domain-containing protein [Haloplasmataceae bacterium]